MANDDNGEEGHEDEEHKMKKRMKSVVAYLTLFGLDEREDLLGESVILGPGVREHIDEGVWKALLQRHLDGPNTHLRAVAAALHVQLPQLLLELLVVRSHGHWTDLCHKAKTCHVRTVGHEIH